eukprot:GILI01032666.1.p1 GENE.GILI01032666.1~~GILI01032666.1.p1  ORF type:complete len:386 (+),score=135.25 GILI01032666.1:85-1158(+)
MPDRCVQLWLTQSVNVTQAPPVDFSFRYTFEFGQMFEDGSLIPTLAPLPKVYMDLEISQTAVMDLGVSSFSFSTAMYRDPGFLISAADFRNGERVHVKTTLGVAVIDRSRFRIDVTDVWICCPEDRTYVPRWAPESGFYGCKNPVPGIMSASNIAHIIAGGAPTTDAIGALFAAAIFPPGLSPFSFPTVSGFSFLAKPLTSQHRMTYYIHIEATVTELVTGGTRRLRQLSSVDQPGVVSVTVDQNGAQALSLAPRQLQSSSSSAAEKPFPGIASFNLDDIDSPASGSPAPSGPSAGSPSAPASSEPSFMASALGQGIVYAGVALVAVGAAAGVAFGVRKYKRGQQNYAEGAPAPARQ